MPATLLCKVAVATDSGLPSDWSVNSYVVSLNTHDVETADYTALTSILTTPYTDLTDYRSSVIDSSANACRVFFYDLAGHLDGSDTGSPVAVRTWTHPPANGVYTPLPEEATVVVTLFGVGRDTAPVETGPEGAKVRPKQRRTGRVYLDLWNHNSVSVVGGRTVVAAQVRDGLAGLFNGLTNQLSAYPGEAVLGVWSRKDAAVRTVTGGFVDNAWDTMRSRGGRPATRTNWTAVLP